MYIYICLHVEQLIQWFAHYLYTNSVTGFRVIIVLNYVHTRVYNINNRIDSLYIRIYTYIMYIYIYRCIVDTVTTEVYCDIESIVARGSCDYRSTMSRGFSIFFTIIKKTTFHLSLILYYMQGNYFKG